MELHHSTGFGSANNSFSWSRLQGTQSLKNSVDGKEQVCYNLVAVVLVTLTAHPQNYDQWCRHQRYSKLRPQQEHPHLTTSKPLSLLVGCCFNGISPFQEDYLSLGKLILSLASKSSAATQNIQKSIELVATHYSAELKNFIIFLLTKPTFPSHSIGDEVAGMVNGYLLREIEYLHKFVIYLLLLRCDSNVIPKLQ